MITDKQFEDVVSSVQDVVARLYVACEWDGSIKVSEQIVHDLFTAAHRVLMAKPPYNVYQDGLVTELTGLVLARKATKGGRE